MTLGEQDGRHRAGEEDEYEWTKQEDMIRKVVTARTRDLRLACC
jgi:hypothetical protein